MIVEKYKNMWLHNAVPFVVLTCVPYKHRNSDEFSFAWFSSKKGEKSLMHLKWYTLLYQVFSWQKRTSILTSISENQILYYSTLEEFSRDQLLALYISNLLSLPLIRSSSVSTMGHIHIAQCPDRGVEISTSTKRN